MFTKWFGSRTPRPSERSLEFRPKLEQLEDRLAPSSLIQPFDGPGNGHGNGNGNGNGGNGNHNNVHYNIHIQGSFNGAVDSFNNIVAVAGTGTVSMPQLGAIGALFNLSGLIAIQTNSAQLGMLIDDEIALAVDTYLVNTLGLSNISGLDNAMSILKTDIANNPLESTMIGQAVGNLAFDLTLNALNMAQPSI